ncbi:MAG: valine--tRNA ligase, partial [Clostridia bacterium]|nr:valine--tRNA ligase [Clostridia bacterium]
MDMAKTYNPSEFEDRIYKTWEKEGYFTPTIDPNKLPFTIVIPPPNITGQLHMGHALDETLQDTLIRFKRMQGYAALWLPGTDHASIATEVKIVEQMAKEGLTKNDVGREGFLKRAWAWKEQYGGRIVEQLKKLGSSCDWSRLSFTMDEKCSRAVKEVFVNLYNKGLIYQGNRIINWCPHCKTALSDAEVEYEEEDSHLWYINYKVKDSDEFLTVATSRPETMLGDTAVAVNPKDKRYKNLVGKTLILPVLNKEIPVIADDYVELDFGTGAVKITPAHDPNDFEVGVRHNLEVIKVIKDDGTMGAAAGEYEGMPSAEYREVIVNKLKELGALVKIEPLHHNVGHCYRCGTTVESTVSKQWFVKMEPLAKPAVEVVKNKKIKFIPQRFSKIYYNWMENIKDWCISRQLWWGHRIPAYYCDDCGEMTVSKENVTVCPKCGGTHVRQDEDVLDTWFSSALWPFSTLGYPDKTPDLDYFYPTDVLVTGYDIIFFWVARMIFSGL